jgi:FtsZ-interacting cell division protein ZipA
MVNEAILGALKSALARGESLKKAMMTVYNAGYKREDISEAARSINEEGSLPQAQPIQQENTTQPKKPATIKTLTPSKKLSRKEKKSKKAKESDKPTKQPQIIQQPQALQQVQPSTKQLQGTPQQAQQPQTPQQVQQPIPGQGVVQKVSGYGQPPTTKSKTMIILLGFILLFLIGILVTIFLFKEELLNFFNNLFS